MTHLFNGKKYKCRPYVGSGHNRESVGRASAQDMRGPTF